VGLNGVGKTNILDAIYYLSVCKSAFIASDMNLIKTESTFFRLEGRYENNVEIVCKYQKGKKTVEFNQISYTSLSEHFGKIPIVMTSPEDYMLIQEGSEERRRFIDYTISTIERSYLEDLLSYNKVLDQRNIYLKKTEESDIDLSLISIYNDQLVGYGTPLLQKRKHYLSILEPLFQKYYHIISSEREKVVIQYDSDIDEHNYGSKLAEGLRKDLILQRTTVGPHKDDFIFLTDDLQTKKFGSQGQQKSFIFALRLAQVELFHTLLQSKPILLIDDIFDKLDNDRVKNLFDILGNLEHTEQIFITHTSSELIKRFSKMNDCEIWNIEQ
jgi:DNA replication and repair protein RecF